MKLFFYRKYGCKFQLNKLLQHFIRVLSDSGVFYNKGQVYRIGVKDKRQEDYKILCKGLTNGIRKTTAIFCLSAGISLVVSRYDG